MHGFGTRCFSKRLVAGSSLRTDTAASTILIQCAAEGHILDPLRRTWYIPHLGYDAECVFVVSLTLRATILSFSVVGTPLPPASVRGRRLQRGPIPSQLSEPATAPARSPTSTTAAVPSPMI